MKDRSTPETDAFFRSFADGDATPSHAEYYDRMIQLERERDEAHDELEQAKQDAKQYEVDCLRALGERNEAREEVKQIRRWATLNGAIQIQRELTKVRKQRDEAQKLLEAESRDSVAIAERLFAVTEQRDTLAAAAKLIADEYEDRCSQFGGDYLWTKHEQTEDIENALAIIHENKNE